MLAVKHNLVDKRMDESVIENLSTAIVVLDRDLEIIFSLSLGQ